MSANDRTSVGSGRPDWQTPPDLFACLNERYRFDYDAFASHKNTLCDTYSTTEGTFVRCPDHRPGPIDGCHHSGAPSRIDERDGLDYPWSSRRVFMNPPYSRGLIERCIEKAYSERDSAAIIVALLPAATETRWFQRYILPSSHIEWLPRRVRYIDPDTGQPGGSPPSGSVIALFRSDLMGASA